jgi:hypothetical protein
MKTIQMKNQILLNKRHDFDIRSQRLKQNRMKYYASVIQKLQRELADAGIIDQQSLAKFLRRIVYNAMKP